MQFNLNDIFRNAFGYEAPDKFEIPSSSQRLEHSKLGQPYYGEDIYGREFFLPVTLEGAFQTFLGLVPFKYLVPFAVMSITSRKTITKIPLPEHGAATESISLDDYVINVKGILINDDNIYPEKEITMLHNIFKVQGNVILRSALSDIFLDGANDHKVIIREIKLPANPGVGHAKPFEIDCISDMIFSLEV